MLISVIICTYNRAALLADALQTVCQQSLDRAEYEIIVVDNNSTDSTPDVTHAFAKRYPNVRYCCEPQQGLSHARNRGWREAKGAYVAYIDDDCKAPAGWLQVAQTIIQQEQPLEFGGPFLAYYNGAKPTWWRDTYDAHHSGGTERATGYLPAKQEVFGGNLFLQRAIFTKIGGFNPVLGMNGRQLAYGEESELHTRLCAWLPAHRAYFDPRLYVDHLVRTEKLSLWWQLHSVMVHGRAGYAIAPKRYPPFAWWEGLFFPFYALLAFGFILLCSWVWRDRARYPFWQNYVYEHKRLHARAHRLGAWSVYMQARLAVARRRRPGHAA